jgi:hypothetical protein
MHQVVNGMHACYPPQFSFFKEGIRDIVAPATITVSLLYKKILNSNYLRRLTEELRALPVNSEARKVYKLSLPYVTPAGIFEQRGNEYLRARSGLIVLDFDHVSDLAKLKKVLRYDPVFGPSLVLYFVSPSGDGLKVLVAVDCWVDHKVSFEAIKSYLQAEHARWVQYLDTSTHDIARACFLAHDPDAYLNPKSDYPTPFPVDELEPTEGTVNDQPILVELPERNEEDIMKAEAWVAGAEMFGGFPDGYKEWFQIACAFATLGEPTGRTLFHRISKLSRKYSPAKCDKQYNAVLKSKQNRFSIGTFIYHCQQVGITPVELEPEEDTADYMSNLLFAADIYPKLPDYLRRCCAPFEGHERDVMLLGTLAILSGCFPGVGGTYHRRNCGLNLFAFIVAPAASGKGTLRWAQRLARPWHKHLLAESAVARADYERKLAAYKKSGDNEEASSPEGPPPRQTLFIPGNTTAAAILTHLAENEGRGIICETEADTLSGAMGADFGNFSDALRNAFQHEPIAMLRKADRQYIDLEYPALSIALTGTPGQVARLLPTAEDGLVSRMLFYTFEQQPTWQDVGPNAGPPLDTYVDKLAEELCGMIGSVSPPSEAGVHSVEVTLTAAEWQRLNEACAAGLEAAVATNGSAGASTAYRLGLIAWRIVGILTVLRYFERQEVPSGTLEAAAVDVSTALSLMDTARVHAMTILQNLAKPATFKASKQATKAEKVANAQELRARGLSLRQIEEQIGIPFNTVRRWLNNLE